MSIAVTVTTEGGQQLVSLLSGLDERSAHMAPAFREIALQIYTEEWNIFESDGAYRGRPRWPALSEDYAKQKAKAIPAKRKKRGATTSGEDEYEDAPLTVGTRGAKGILEFSGKLRLSLTTSTHEDSILHISDSGLALGSKRLVEHKGKSLALGHLHATGAGHLPVRESLTVVDAQVAEWGDKIAAHLAGETP